MTQQPISVADQKSQIIAGVYRQWASEQGDIQPEPEYLVGDEQPSQYAEGIAALSAGADADAELDRRVMAALAEAGLA